MGFIQSSGRGTPLENAGVPGAGTDEVQTLTLSAVPASGKWRVKFEGQTTTELAHNVSAADLQAALVALPTIGTAGVVVGLVGQVYTCTFSGGNMQKLNIPQMTVPYNTIKDAGNAAVTVTPATTVAGVTATHRTAPTGALCIDTTNGVLYINTSTTSMAPTWTKVGAQ